MNQTRALDRPPAGELQQAFRCIVDRLTAVPAWVVMIQLFIGFGWLRAVAEKLIDPHWWTGEVITDFVLAHQGSTLGWYLPFLDAVVVPAAPLIALIVVVGQLAAGLSLVTGRRLGVGLGVGIFLNLHFLAAGAVTPSAFYLLAQGALALWLAERTPSLRSIRRLDVVAGIAGFLAALSLPFVSTLDPALVIEDPAVMFAFGGSLTALTCVLASSAHRDSRSSSTSLGG